MKTKNKIWILGILIVLLYAAIVGAGLWYKEYQIENEQTAAAKSFASLTPLPTPTPPPPPPQLPPPPTPVASVEPSVATTQPAESVTPPPPAPSPAEEKKNEVAQEPIKTPPPVEPAPATSPAPPLATVTPPTPAATEAENLPAKRAIAIRPYAIILNFDQFASTGAKAGNTTSLTAEQFEAQMHYLSEGGYQVVPLSNIVHFARDNSQMLPPKAVAITITGGYKSAYQIAYPILQKYHYPWTFFCSIDFIGAGSGVTWAQLQEMQNNGVQIGSLSKSHPLLSKRKDRSQNDYEKWVKDELEGSRAILEKKLQKPVTLFAYPFGDWSPFVEEQVGAAGYEGAVTLALKPITPETTPLRMGRYTIDSKTNKMLGTYLKKLE